MRHPSIALLLFPLSLSSSISYAAHSDASSAPASARVSVEVGACVPVDRGLYLKILSIELGVELLGPREKQATLVTTTCAGDGVTVDVVNPNTARSVGRTVDLKGESKSSGARLLALATAELVESSRLEFSADGKPFRAGQGLYDEPEPEPRALYLTLAAAGQLASPDVRSDLGGALRVEGDLTTNLRWVTGLDATFSNASTDLGDVSTQLLTARAGLSHAWVGEHASLRAGLDLRGGGWRVVGEPAPGAVGQAVWLPFVSTAATARVSVAATEAFAVDLGAQVGLPLTRTFVTLDGSRGLGLDGVWALIDLGVQVRFGS